MSKKHDIIWVDSVDSTNEYARRHILEFDNLSVIATLEQTDGKGQGDHRWHSEPGQNILASIILKDISIDAAGQKKISDITAQSVTRLLHKYGIQAWIKPPNDIWVGQKKICGILIEHSIRGNRISWSIIGIGLNVNQTLFPDTLPNPTSMALLIGKTDIRKLLSELVEIFTDLSSSL